MKEFFSGHHSRRQVVVMPHSKTISLQYAFQLFNLTQSRANLHFSPFLLKWNKVFRDDASFLCFILYVVAIYRIKSHVVSKMNSSISRSYIFKKKHILRLSRAGGRTEPFCRKHRGENRQQQIFIFRMNYKTSINFHQRDYCESFFFGMEMKEIKIFQAIRAEEASSLSINNETLWYYSDVECTLILAN